MLNFLLISNFYGLYVNIFYQIFSPYGIVEDIYIIRDDHGENRGLSLNLTFSLFLNS